MVFQDNISEEAYNEKLLGKLSAYRTAAAAKNTGKVISKKLLNSLNEARRTQRMLVGESTVFKAPAAPEPVTEQPVEATVDSSLMTDQFDYLNQLNELSEDNESDDFDMDASFDEVEQKMRDNANDEAIEEEA